MIRYRELQPSIPLCTIVDRFWILEHDGCDSALQRVVPDGCPEIILNWSQPFESFSDGRWQTQPRCFVAGQIDGPLLLRPNGPVKTLGIRFRPHGLALILGQPANELSGRFTPIDELSPTLSRDLNRAMETPDPIAAVKAAVLSNAGACADGDPLIAEAIYRIDRTQGSMDLASLAHDLGLSVRQFERRFLATVGLPPKRFCRIQRFSQVFRMLEEGSSSWVETAIACGYYDQAHLIHDCKRLTGNTPTVLLSEEADLARHFYKSRSYNTGLPKLR